MISFIVPIYNVEKYLIECIESILLQVNIDKEIILVDDGSTDSSLAICREYQERYPEIKVYTKSNGGLSSTRNFGIEKAVGEYITFIDSDDFYRKDFASQFIQLAEDNKLDIIRGNYLMFSDESKDYIIRERNPQSYYGQVLSGIDYLKLSIQSSSYEVVTCTTIYRTQYLRDISLKFELNRTYEDHEFTLRLLASNYCRVLHMPDSIYAYRMRSGSITKTPKIQDIKSIIENINSIFLFIDTLPTQKKKYPLKAVSMLFYQLTSVWCRLNKEDQDNALNILPSKLKFRCLMSPFDRYQFFKIAMFCFTPKLVSLIFKIRISR